MGKSVLTKKDVEKCFYEGSRVLFISKDTIILPGAMDLIKSASIKVIRLDDGDELKNYLEEVCIKNGITDEKVCNKILELIRKKLSEKGGKSVAVED